MLAKLRVGTGTTGESASGLSSPSSMLYSGSDVIRDLEWVIFDEVHYINDAEVRSIIDPRSPFLWSLFSSSLFYTA